MIQLTCPFSIDNHWRYGSLICITTLIIHVRVQYFTTVLYCLHSRDSAVVHYVHFYKTHDTTVLYYICWLPLGILQSYLHDITPNQGAIPSWSYNQIVYNGDEIIGIMNRNWLSLTVTLKITSQNWIEERITWAVSSCLTPEKFVLPECSKCNFGGQLRPTNTVARWSFRAIPGNRANGVVKAWLRMREQYHMKIGVITGAYQYLNKEELISLFTLFSLLYPYLTYCNHIWCSYKTSLKRLITLQI